MLKDETEESTEISLSHIRHKSLTNSDFVLDKDIFSNVFDKDIRRVYIYKKTERLAKALQLIAPAFAASLPLKGRLEAVSVGLINAATINPKDAKEAFSRELLALSSVLAMARASGALSPMNAELIAGEAHALLGEIAAYEAPRVFLDESPTLAEIAKQASGQMQGRREVPSQVHQKQKEGRQQGAELGTPTQRGGGGRREVIVKIIKDKGTVYIKDISTIVRDVSEKTIQRELQQLIGLGVVRKTGNRRWTAYSLSN